MQCNQQSSELTLSPAKLTGLFIIIAPAFSAAFAIFLLSVDTYIFLMFLFFLHNMMDLSIKEYFPTFFKFLFGIPLEPPLAGIIANVSGNFVPR